MPQTAERRPWTREELIAAFNLYCQLPFGKLHKTNPQIILKTAVHPPERVANPTLTR